MRRTTGPGAVSLELYRLMVERARHMRRIADVDAAEQRYDIALFHLEQAAQLMLRAYLLRTVGDFPRTHHLADLARLAQNGAWRSYSTRSGT